MINENIIQNISNASPTDQASDNINVVKRKRKKNIKTETSILTKPIANLIWLSISEAAKIGGVQNKTIRRGITNKTIKYKIVGNKYFVDLTTLIQFLYTKTKLKNKLLFHGIGQYVDKWRE
jgi:excisionase family DNA binding protein